MKLSEIILLSIFLVFCLIVSSIPLKAEKDNYYIHYGYGNYAGAMATAYSDFFLTNGNSSKAVLLFRIYEAARFPEDASKAIGYLEKLSDKINRKDNLELYSLQQSLLINLYQRIGDSSKLSQVRGEAAFITEMQLLGPFEISESKGLSLINPDAYKSNHISKYNYKGMDISWRKINSDVDGIFRIDNYYENISKIGFVAERYFTAQKNSTYHLFIGSSGNIICEVNGAPVYESTDTIEMFPSQIHLTIDLSQGSHLIRIKTKGNIREQCSFSLQLFDNSGSPINGVADVENKGKLKSFSSSSGNCISSGSGFNEQYLRYMSGLNIKNESFNSMSSSAEKVFYPYHLYYQILEEGDSSIIERKLKVGLTLSPDNPLLLEQLVKLKLRYNRLEECDKVISRFEKYPQSPVGIILSIEFALTQHWYEEALSLCDKLSATGYPYTADKFRIECWKGLGDSNKAFTILQSLFQNGVYREYVSNEISNTVSSVTRHGAMLSLMDSVISKEQNNMQLRILLAESYLEKNDPNIALAYLISIAKISSCRDDVLFLIGRCYEKMGKYDLAKYYFNQARKVNPQIKKI